MLSNNLIEFQNLFRLSYFTVEDVAALLNIQIQSARVFCSRYTKKGLLVKLKNNFYITSKKSAELNIPEMFTIANILQVPSYVSFMTGLAYYEITTQVPRDFIESASLKRTANYTPGTIIYRYYKLNKNLYTDFVRINNVFIATAEKCFLDSVYLYSFGKYKIDFSSLDLNKLDKKRLTKLLNIYPSKTKKIAEKLCMI